MSDIQGSEPDWQLASKVAPKELGQRMSFNYEVEADLPFGQDIQRMSPLLIKISKDLKLDRSPTHSPLPSRLYLLCR
jgi:hypothetical protein